MQEKELGHTEEVRRYLESYLIYAGMLAGNRYARTYLGELADGEKSAEDDPFLKAKMFSVRRFIMDLPDCREKMLLYYRYLHGHPVEKCADLMGVSRRTAFRIAKDALVLAQDNFARR